MTRNISFSEGEFYHIYNRGVDKRNIFFEDYDVERFYQSMDEFNCIDPIGSIYENSFIKSPLGSSTAKLVNIICFCLNPNHYHFLLEQVAERGIEKFMHKLGGYTQYFNQRYQRTGALFQGRYKAKHVTSNEYLLHLSAYINLNNRVHQLGNSTAKLMKSSWDEYLNKKEFCKTDVILDQFKTPDEYKKFAMDSLDFTLERRKKDVEFANLLLE